MSLCATGKEKQLQINDLNMIEFMEPFHESGVFNRKSPYPFIFFC